MLSRVCEWQVDYIVVCDRVMSRWRHFCQLHSSSPQPPSLACDCSDTLTEAKTGSGGRNEGNGAASDKCKFGDVLHVWPAHEADRLHSTRIDSMFSSHSTHTCKHNRTDSHRFISLTFCHYCVSVFVRCSRSDHYPLLADLNFIQ